MISLSPVESALEAVERGWYVFPLVANGKTPLVPWRNVSTNRAHQVREFAERFPECNWGVDCGKSGLVVVDVDVKSGKPGQQQLMLLELEHRTLRNTFTVTTPSGGWHLYFAGQTRSVNGLRPGVDIKSSGGYVVLYGSTLAGNNYWISNVAAVQTCPDWLSEVVGVRPERAANSTQWLTEPDKPEYVAAAIDFLTAEAPDSVEGQSGDDTLVKRVFMPLRDMGISETKAVELVSEHYNFAKCFPPWSERELEVKAANAYRYALQPAGSATTEGQTAIAKEMFGAVEPVPSTTGTTQEPHKPTIPYILGSSIVETTLPPRRWILGRRLIRGYITGTFSPGGVGKSLLTYVEALAVATGLPLTGDTVHTPGPVLCFNAEDGADELKMRLVATARFHGIDLTKTPHPIYLLSGRDLKLRVVGQQADGTFAAHKGAVALLDQMIRETGAVLFVGDPFVRLHDADENNNVAVDKVVEVFTDLAHRHGISVHLVHHTRKKNGAGGEGDADTARGASSFVAAVRLAHTLSAMSEADAKLHGITEQQRPWYVRLDDAKLNLAPPSESVRWFKKVDVELANGEHVGALQRVNLAAVVKLSADKDGVPGEIGRAIYLMEEGKRELLTDVAARIRATTDGETRAPHAIGVAIQRFLEAKPEYKWTAAEWTIRLVDAGVGKRPRYWLEKTKKAPSYLD